MRRFIIAGLRHTSAVHFGPRRSGPHNIEPKPENILRFMSRAIPTLRRVLRRRHQRARSASLTAVVLAICISTWCTASAHAATQNTVSDHGALIDYRNYVARLFADIPAARNNAAIYANKLACSGAVAKANLSSNSEQALYDEINADVELRLLRVNTGPLSHLITALAGNASTWDDLSENVIIAKFERAENAMLALKTSALCADALRFAAAPGKLPATTRQFLKIFEATNVAAEQNLSAFVSGVLVKNEARGDLQLIKSANAFAKHYQQSFSAAALNITNQIAIKLGLVSG